MTGFFSMYINEMIKFKKEALCYEFVMERGAATLGQNNSLCILKTGGAMPSPLSLRKKQTNRTHTLLMLFQWSLASSRWEAHSSTMLDISNS